MSPIHSGIPPTAYRVAPVRPDPVPISASTTPVPHSAPSNQLSSSNQGLNIKKSSPTVRPANNNLSFNPPSMKRSHTPCSSPNPIPPGGTGLASHPAQRPANPLGSSRHGPAAITADQLHQIQHRHQLEMALVKQQACLLKEEKAFLVAQNLRLERELCLQSHALAPAGLGEQRRLDLKARPSFSRSRSHPNADYRDPHRPISMHSPTHSGSSSSSHPWPSSGGPSTPSSLSPRSLHSRNPSSASLAVPSAHGHGPSISRRPSFTGAGGPDLAVLQRALRGRAAGPGGADDWARAGARSNPSSAGTSRRNSLTGSNGCDPPLKGILKPSTPIRPMSSCALAPGHPARRTSAMGGYFAEDGYDSITRPKTHRSAHSNSSLLNPHHLHQLPFAQPRSRRGSLDTISGEVERMRFCNGRGHA